MRYFKRFWNESRGDEYDHWGTCMYYFETDDLGWPMRQIEEYQNGVVSKYDRNKIQDKFGALADQQLELEEFDKYEIEESEFQRMWDLE